MRDVNANDFFDTSFAIMEKCLNDCEYASILAIQCVAELLVSNPKNLNSEGRLDMEKLRRFVDAVDKWLADNEQRASDLVEELHKGGQ